MNDDTRALLEKWNSQYDYFKTKWRNTQTMHKKAEYVKAIAREYSNRIPLEVIVNPSSRDRLSQKLFGKSNGRNYVLYSLCMACHLKVIRRDGVHLVCEAGLQADPLRP